MLISPTDLSAADRSARELAPFANFCFAASRVLNPTEKSLGKARLGREELKIARLG